MIERIDDGIDGRIRHQYPLRPRPATKLTTMREAGASITSCLSSWASRTATRTVSARVRLPSGGAAVGSRLGRVSWYGRTNWTRRAVSDIEATNSCAQHCLAWSLDATTIDAARGQLTTSTDSRPGRARQGIAVLFQGSLSLASAASKVARKRIQEQQRSNVTTNWWAFFGPLHTAFRCIRLRDNERLARSIANPLRSLPAHSAAVRS
jgi:hypothetical protein